MPCLWFQGKIMNCFHPFCPMSISASVLAWGPVVDRPELKIKASDRSAVAAFLDANFREIGKWTPTPLFPSPLNRAMLKRLLQYCPCLFTQIEASPTARAVVHLCELTLGARIDSSNVHDAFLIQHPRPGTPPMAYPPRGAVRNIGGTIMEFLCSEVLTSADVPLMKLDSDKWPEWVMPGHIIMNEGRMQSLKAFGDILIPCAPTNLVISVKSEAARERLLYSSNSIEGVGFGFFNQPEEFWTSSRMALFKRMGFSAIYMPDATHALVMGRVTGEGRERHAVNINGADLYRPLTRFGDDMKRVVGRSTIEL
jgi:hypothetical protein